MEPMEAEAESAGRGRGGRGPAARAPKGPSFAMPVALGSAVVAAILAFVGTMVVGQLSAGGGNAFDAAGVQAVRMLAATDTESWNKDYGTTHGVRNRVLEAYEALKAKFDDERDVTRLDDAFKIWMEGPEAAEDAKLTPTFDKLVPEDTIGDEMIRNSRAQRLKQAMEGDAGVFEGASIQDGSGKQLLGVGLLYRPAGNPLRTVGETKVYGGLNAQDIPVRIFTHPMRNRKGREDGVAMVFLVAASAKPANIVGAAGAAAGGAFLGAFVVALMMCLGPIKYLRRLAVDTEALARGELNTRVLTRGPDIVQAIAKNVQRLGAMAAEGGEAAPPQIVTEQVVVEPTEEIVAGLAPMRNFDRPPALEIESTTKACPEAGNDYHDTVNIDDEHAGFFIADIPMQGVQGALYMAQVRAVFRAEFSRSTSPAEVLRAVNAAFAKDLPRGVYVTAMYCVVNTQTGICRVASAQHLPLVFWKLSKKGSARLQPEGIALGLDPGPVFDKAITEKAIQLEKGDRIVMYTDGAITARNANNNEYGEERFYYVINREAPKNSAAFVNFVANDVDLFHEGAQQLDDFTILTVRRIA